MSYFTDKGWIENTGKCPFPKGTLVDVKYREGTVNIGVSALTQNYEDGFITGNQGLDATDWTITNDEFDITYSRLHVKPAEKEDLSTKYKKGDKVQIVPSDNYEYDYWYKGGEIYTVNSVVYKDGDWQIIPEEMFEEYGDSVYIGMEDVELFRGFAGNEITSVWIDECSECNSDLPVCIRVETSDEVVDLTIQEARQLYGKLKEIFDNE